MQHLAVGKRSSFELWLRTGHRSCPDIAQTLECKFNPWHDPDDGRFTFAGSGRHYGGSAGRDSQQAARSARRKAGPLRVDVPGLPSDQSTRGFGGGGGAGSWAPHSRTTQRQPGLLGPSPSRPAAVRQKSVQHELSGLDGQARATLPFKRVAKTVIRHGYRFDIDHLGRTWKVEGTITEDPLQRRSKQSQLQAGGKYRLRTDDGGHFIARRFKGPMEAFNHFAQDAEFNRKTYARMENEWASARRKGVKVTVKIVPVDKGQSRRPSSLNIWYTIGNKQHGLNLANQRGAE
jgi:hypothetical protein